MIQVFFGTVAALVRNATLFDKPIATLPEPVQLPLLGHALGRVVAHELGHWTVGRTHSLTGLMRERFGPSELLDPTTPRLPRAWTSAAMDGLLTGSPRCVTTQAAVADKSR